MKLAGTADAPIDMGTLTIPEASTIDEPWIFRASCQLKAPAVVGKALVFGLILDLGFGIYKQIDVVLDGAIVTEGNANLCTVFAENWAANGQPNPLEVITLDQLGLYRVWNIHLYRVELELETLKTLGRTSLVDALVEQGLVERTIDVQADA